MAPRLCSRCQNFDLQSFRRGTSKLPGYPLVEFVKSAKSGCSFCSLMLQNLEAAELENGTRNLLEMAVRHVAGESRHRLFNINTWGMQVLSWVWRPWLNIYPVQHPAAEDLETGDQGQDALHICELRAFTAIAPGAASLGDARPKIHLHVAADPGTPAHSSRDIVGRIQTESYSWTPYHAKSLELWHQRCAQSHRNCSLSISRRLIGTGDVPLPARCVEILSVSGDDWNGPDPPKLALRETAGLRGRYVALSHRWDRETETTRTTSANYALQKEECRGTPVFYDAARVAASQGIRYIWIDSLCIVQDSADDWDAESVQMAEYYQRAWLTIVATTRHDTGGLFGTPQAQEIAPLARLPYRDRQGVQKGHFYLQCVGQKSLARNYSENIGRSPLLRRGWIYQEWMLSRRLLAFSHGSVFVLCSEGPKTLAGDHVEPLDSKNTDKQTVDRAFKSSMFSDLDSYVKVVSAWENIVETYSSLEMSQIDQDRLVALAGVAKEFGEAIKALQEAGRWYLRNGNEAGAPEVTPTFDALHQYVCGMWKFHPRGLLWEQLPLEPGRRFRLPGIPTWSWASMEMRAPSSATGGEEGSQVVRRGMGVQWSRKQREISTSRKPVRSECGIVKAIRIRVDAPEWEPRFEARDAEDVVSTTRLNGYGNYSRFFALGLRGRLLPTLVHDFFQSEGDIRIAANLTDHSVNRGRHLWRRVTTVEEPDSIVGWASLEHPEYQDPAPEPLHEGDPSQRQQEQDAGSGEDQRHQQQTRQPQDLFAFVVTSMPKTPGGFGFGNLSGNQTSFEVLYLARKAVPAFGDDECFERVGTGRLFGNDVEAIFRRAEEKTLWLV